MTSHVSRTRKCFGLLLVLASGCAHPGKTSQGQVADTTQTGPSHPATVTAADIQRHPQEPIETALMGRFAGVDVTRTADGGIAIRIRGVTSILGSNEPLYVLDGIPIEPGPNGSLSGINPNDIASMEVLKDPASTARYGVRGANGVIIIKSKQADQ